MADEEAQMDRPLHDPQGQEDEQRGPKPAWLDQNGQYAPALVAMAAVFLNQLPSGEDFIHEHNVHFITPLAFILFFLFLFAGILWVFKCEISSGTERVQYYQKMVIMILNLLIEAALMSGNVIFLAMVDKSYLLISVSIATLGFILLVIIFYSKQPDQGHEPQGPDHEAVENMVKNCFKVATFTGSIGFGVQMAVVIYCLKNQVYHPQYCLIVAFLTSTLGSFSSTITTSPLKFQGDLMRRILEQMPIIMLLFQGLVAVFVAAKILDPTMVVLAVCIPSIVMFLVTLCPKSTNLREHAAQEDYKSMFGALAGFGIGAILALYSQKLESGVTYLTSAVLFLLMAVLTSLMRMAFVFRLKCAFAELVNNALPMALTLVGVALLLIKFFSEAVASIGMEIAARPIAVPGQVFPPFPH